MGTPVGGTERGGLRSLVRAVRRVGVSAGGRKCAVSGPRGGYRIENTAAGPECNEKTAGDSRGGAEAVGMVQLRDSRAGTGSPAAVAKVDIGWQRKGRKGRKGRTVWCVRPGRSQYEPEASATVRRQDRR